MPLPLLPPPPLPAAPLPPIGPDEEMRLADRFPLEAEDFELEGGTIGGGSYWWREARNATCVCMCVLRLLCAVPSRWWVPRGCALCHGAGGSVVHVHERMKIDCFDSMMEIACDF